MRVSERGCHSSPCRRVALFGAYRLARVGAMQASPAACWLTCTAWSRTTGLPPLWPIGCCGKGCWWSAPTTSTPTMITDSSEPEPNGSWARANSGSSSSISAHSYSHPFGPPIKIFNEGRMQRDFTYIDDSTRAIGFVRETSIEDGTRHFARRFRDSGCRSGHPADGRLRSRYAMRMGRV